MGGDRPRRWLSPARALTAAAVLPFVAAVSVHGATRQGWSEGSDDAMTS